MPKQIKKAEKSLEELLWDSANKLRGTVVSYDYMNVCLGLIFLKYAGDRFDARRAELIVEHEVDEFHKRAVFRAEYVLKRTGRRNVGFPDNVRHRGCFEAFFDKHSHAHGENAFFRVFDLFSCYHSVLIMFC